MKFNIIYFKKKIKCCFKLLKIVKELGESWAVSLQNWKLNFEDTFLKTGKSKYIWYIGETGAVVNTEWYETVIFMSTLLELMSTISSVV